MTIPPATVLLDRDTLALADELGARDSVQDLVKLVNELKKAGHPQERIHHALEQVRLRRKAQTKLGAFADRMLFTESGLEQATRLQVAAHHAGRFQRSGIAHVADVGSGLGVDAMALASLGIQVTAFERDELTAALATYNLAPFGNATVVHSDALDADFESFGAFWADPARRNASKRLVDPNDWSPSLDALFRLAEKMPAGIKLAPGIDRDLLPANSEWQWVSVSGETVEAAVWTGVLAQEGIGRSALVLRDSHAHELTASGDAEDEPVGELGRYIFEPDGAIIRSRLIGDVARNLGGRMLHPTIAYITSDAASTTPFATGFAVTDVMPYKTAALKKWVKENDIGVLEIKKRGIDVDPSILRKQLSPRGANTATLILTRVGDKRLALAATRLETAELGKQETSSDEH